MNREEYLKKAKEFKPPKDFIFFLANGLELAEMTPAQFAKKVEVIPGSVSRWMYGVSAPLDGMQMYVIKTLCRIVEHGSDKST